MIILITLGLFAVIFLVYELKTAPIINDIDDIMRNNGLYLKENANKGTKMRTYDIEFMGIDGNDMYDISVEAEDIDSAITIAYDKRDKEDDRLISIIERM